MTDVQTFDFHSNPIRIIDLDGETWFLAKDVCDVLEVGNPSQALTRLDEDERNTLILNDGIGNPTKSVINESGLYSLVLSSRKPEAKAFKRWVTSEVLPAIRKHGGYLTAEKTAELIANPDLIIELATNLKEERSKRERAEQRAELQSKQLIASAPKVEYYDTVLDAPDSILTNVIAKELGMSAITLNRRLKEKKVLYLQGGTYVLYHQYQDKGFTKTKTHTYTDRDGIEHTAIQTVWTQKGREFIHRMIKGAN